jgi:hypothetical protein
VQWKIFDEVVSAEEIQSMREFCTSETARKEVEAKQKAEKFVADVLALKGDKKDSHLQQAGGDSPYGSKLVAINLRRELKATS